MKEDKVIEKIINIFKYIDDDDTKVIRSHDYEDERVNSMVVVGIEGSEKLHPFVPDYRYDVTIIVDSFIEGDENRRKI